MDQFALYETISDVDSKLLDKLNTSDTLSPVTDSNKIITQADATGGGISQ
jgi:hypothetical protein